MIENISIFLDESGDLGFDWNKGKTSKYLVITLLICENKTVVNGIKKAVVRTLKNKINKKNKHKNTSELKGSSTTFNIKKYFYRHLPNSGWSIYAVTLNKKRVDSNLQTKPGKKKLYNFLANFLIEKIHFPNSLKTVNLVLDKCKNTAEIKDFNFYLENQLQASLPSLDVRLDINHELSHTNFGLQAVDLFCWGIARKESFGESDWYDVYKDKIKFETVYLK